MRESPDSTRDPGQVVFGLTGPPIVGEKALKAPEKHRRTAIVAKGVSGPGQKKEDSRMVVGIALRKGEGGQKGRLRPLQIPPVQQDMALEIVVSDAIFL
jgi:hypothetical protein